MVMTNDLRAEITRNYKTVANFCRSTGISGPRLYKALQTGRFETDLMMEIQDHLNLSDPWSIFFAPELTQEDKRCKL